MVERIKDAINKARQARQTGTSSTATPDAAPLNRPSPATGTMTVAGGAAPPPPRPTPSMGRTSAAAAPPPPAAEAEIPSRITWNDLPLMSVDADGLEKAKVVSFSKQDPAHVPIDILRTKLLKEMRTRGWRSVAITSPTPECGKTFLSSNLAFGLARQSALRTMVLDFDLRKPQLDQYLGSVPKKSLEQFLKGNTAPEDYFCRVTENLAVGLNSERILNSSELVYDTEVRNRLRGVLDLLGPDVVVFDMPPMLTTDDVLAFVSDVDCVVLVAAAGVTTAEEIDDCERQLSELTNFVGVVLNKCYAASTDVYEYGA